VGYMFQNQGEAHWQETTHGDVLSASVNSQSDTSYWLLHCDQAVQPTKQGTASPHGPVIHEHS